MTNELTKERNNQSPQSPNLPISQTTKQHYMKRLTLLASLLSAALCSVAQTLPVLRLSVPDTITATMEYSNGEMTLQEEGQAPVVLKARFKSRGATAKQYIKKPSLSMKLTAEDYDTEVDSSLLKLPRISHYILNAMAIDRICMRDRVLMDLWNQASRLPYETDFDGRNGTLGHFVEVYINDEYKGIYCLSTRINRSLLHLKKYDKEMKQVRGVLYKCGTMDIADQNNRGWTSDSLAMTVQWHAAFELKHPDKYAGREAWQRQWERWKGKSGGQQMVSDLNKEIELIINWYSLRFAQMDEYFGTTPTAIASPQAQTQDDAAWYNLQGKRIQKPTQRGIYIQGNKKVLY